MNWFDNLRRYFPIEEMKSQQHLELLLKERNDLYYKDESSSHVMMYAELNTCIFIDYLWVSSEARGKGIGKKLINKFKENNKPIILEVEPIDYEDTDTEKRLRFYKRQGFNHANSIEYRPRSLATDKETTLEILYWSPDDSAEEVIYQQMKDVYTKIHTYKDKEVYGESYQSVDKVLRIINERKRTNVLEKVAIAR